MRVCFGAKTRRLFGRVFGHPVSPSTAGESDRDFRLDRRTHNGFTISFWIKREMLNMTSSSPREILEFKKDYYFLIRNTCFLFGSDSAMLGSSDQTLLQPPGGRRETRTLHAATPNLQNKSHRSHHGGRVHERGPDQPGDGESWSDALLRQTLVRQFSYFSVIDTFGHWGAAETAALAGLCPWCSPVQGHPPGFPSRPLKHFVTLFWKATTVHVGVILRLAASWQNLWIKYR